MLTSLVVLEIEAKFLKSIIHCLKKKAMWELSFCIHKKNKEVTIGASLIMNLVTEDCKCSVVMNDCFVVVTFVTVDQSRLTENYWRNLHSNSLCISRISLCCYLTLTQC